MGRASTTPATRAAGVLPLLAGVLSAMTLTGAAVYTVSEARCDTGEYVQRGGTVALVGSCVDGADLRDKGLTHTPDPATAEANYRP
ncbi:hypothetical protein [Saccharomonospora saliphila]|uniref:hypothetical protein n=1 Tax=Saccharomonospora saliphila TaxID=369829 RepID=UPI0003630BA5|nr:hypothetical protein [Saccharomonospora saliphila]